MVEMFKSKTLINYLFDSLFTIIIIFIIINIVFHSCG
jgi:hypothetical protein